MLSRYSAFALEDYIIYHDKVWCDDTIRSLRKARDIARNAEDTNAERAIGWLLQETERIVKDMWRE